jgi:diguanylate cyclase (GGDEF)-like protein/PAS domain S-box-containing protein
MPDGLAARQSMPRWVGTQDASFLNTIVDALPGAVGYWDADLICRFANAAHFEWFGKRPETVVGTHYRDLMNEHFYRANEPYLRLALAGNPVSYERTLPRPDGSPRHLFVNYIPDRDQSGMVAGFFVHVNDVTQIKNAEAQLEIGTAVFENAADGIIVTDARGTILSVNPAFTEITGYSAAEAIGQNPRILKSDRQGAGFFTALWTELTTFGRWQGEIWNRRKNGELFIERQTIRLIRNSADGIVRYVAVFSDITELWQKSERVRHLAFHDGLTGLPNRDVLIGRLDDAIATAQLGTELLAVMFIDLDGFKNVNDQLGHDVGDNLLKLVAQKLQGLMRPTDMVARIGGDEFGAFLINLPNQDPAARIARSMISAINEPLDLRGKIARVGVSIGIAMYPTHGRSAEDLLRLADAAMYDVKSSGKNAFGFASLAAK